MITCEIKCPACGSTNSIEEHGTHSSGMMVLPVWCDQSRHVHDPNRYITTFKCGVVVVSARALGKSQRTTDGRVAFVCGALWDIIHLVPCPVEGCSYGDEINEQVVHRTRSTTEVDLGLRERKSPHNPPK